MPNVKSLRAGFEAAGRHTGHEGTGVSKRARMYVERRAKVLSCMYEMPQKGGKSSCQFPSILYIKHLLHCTQGRVHSPGRMVSICRIVSCTRSSTNSSYGCIFYEQQLRLHFTNSSYGCILVDVSSASCRGSDGSAPYRHAERALLHVKSRDALTHRTGSGLGVRLLESTIAEVISSEAGGKMRLKP